MDKSDGYEVTPARLVIPAMPLMAEGVSNTAASTRSELRKELSEAPLKGVRTLPTNIAWTQEQRRVLIAKCLRMIRARKLLDLYRQIETHPALALDRQLRDALSGLIESARYRRGRGRPSGRDGLYPLLIVALVDDLVATDKAGNKEKAFHLIAELNVDSYDAVRRKYYRALDEPRFRGMLVELEQTRQATPAEYAAIARAESLPAAGEIRREIEIPGMGIAELIFTATEKGPK